MRRNNVAIKKVARTQKKIMQVDYAFLQLMKVCNTLCVKATIGNYCILTSMGLVYAVSTHFFISVLAIQR